MEDYTKCELSSGCYPRLFLLLLNTTHINTCYISLLYYHVHHVVHYKVIISCMQVMCGEDIETNKKEIS